MQENLIDKYLLERGLWEPKSGLKDGETNEIMTSDENLALAAGFYNTYGNVLAMIIREKVKRMALELIRDAAPQETIVIRQAMIEVSDIYDDAEKYATEYKKRIDERESQGTPASGEAAPTFEDNAEAPPPEVVTGDL